MSLASMYEAMAERIRAGEAEATVLADYGLMRAAHPAPPATGGCPWEVDLSAPCPKHGGTLYECPTPPQVPAGRIANALQRVAAHSVPPATGAGLTFQMLHEQNAARCRETWHELDVWSLSDWATALAGEVGEACNVIKKLRRTTLPGPQHLQADEATLREQLRDEIGDVLAYLDLLSTAAGFTLEEAAVRKWNIVSERVGSPRRLPAAFQRAAGGGA